MNILTGKQKIQKLEQKLLELESLNRLSRVLATLTDVDDILRHIMEEIIAVSAAEQASILLFETGSSEITKTLIRQQDESATEPDHRASRLLAGWISKNRKPLLTNDIEREIGLGKLGPPFSEIGSALSVPLLVQNELIGVINLINRKHRSLFSELQLKIVTVLSSQSAQFIKNARLQQKLFAENINLKKLLSPEAGFEGIIGSSPQMQKVFELVKSVAPQNTRVLLEGESGTGKELIAKAIHLNSPRCDRPYITVDCGALPANLLESELFGHVKGAFTGAIKDKRGLFEEANHGTIFLDEIGNAGNEIHTRLLRVIEEEEIRPVGATRPKKIDVRIIAASSTDLRQGTRTGTFREDLFYRLNVVKIQLPPLRERKKDIFPLAQYFLEKYKTRTGKAIQGIEPGFMRSLENYAWPGNVRELENVIERAVTITPNDEYLSVSALPEEITGKAAETTPTIEASKTYDLELLVGEYEKSLLIQALENSRWNQSEAGRLLGITEKKVRYKMARYGIKRRQ